MQKGDIVVCVKPTSGVKKGHSYIIYSATTERGQDYVTLQGEPEHNWYAWRFIKIEV